MADDISCSHDPFPPFESFPALQSETFPPNAHLLLLRSKLWQTPPLPHPDSHCRNLRSSACSVCSPHHSGCACSLTLSHLCLYHICTLIISSHSCLHVHHICMFIFIHSSYLHAYHICMLPFAQLSYFHTKRNT